MATKKTPPKAHPCVVESKDSLIKVEENKACALISNPRKERVRKIKVDGCVVTDGLRCDWIVSKDECVDVLIELKGVDVKHAVHQIMATLDIWATHPLRGQNVRLAALVVCRQYPKFDTSVQRAALSIAKKHKAPLHVRSRKDTLDLCKLAKFGG